jgi:hypothetical protein
MLPSSVLRSVGDRIGGALLLATRAGSLGGELSSLHFRREVNCGFQSRAGRARVLKTVGASVVSAGGQLLVSVD